MKDLLIIIILWFYFSEVVLKALILHRLWRHWFSLTVVNQASFLILEKFIFILAGLQRDRSSWHWRDHRWSSFVSFLGNLDELFVKFLDILLLIALFAQRAIPMALTPRKDAFAVEVMSLITRQTDYFLTIFERLHAYYAFFIGFMQVWIELSFIHS